MNQKIHNNLNSKIKITIFIVIWITLFSQVLFNEEIKEQIFYLLELHPILAPFIFIILQVLFAIFALPCSPLTLFAGILWGLGIGIIYSTIATLFASVSTFLLGRYVIRKRTKEQAMKDWHIKVLALIDKYKWKASLVAHINPLFPASPLGYAFGLSEISLFTFTYGAILGTLPLQLALVGAGDASNFILNIF